MAVQVKCQHCWKIFEVSEDAVGKQRACIFCQRLMVIKPLTDAENKGETNEYMITNLMGKVKTLQVLVLILLVFFAINLITLFWLGKKQVTEDALREVYLQEKPQWQATVESSLQNLQQQVNKLDANFQRTLQEMEKQTKFDMDSMLSRLIENFNNKLDQIERNLQKMQATLDERLPKTTQPAQQPPDAKKKP